ncbi:protein SMG9 [Drosophila grimshawi]|uniref:GH17623 n=1 Tax=Drosophila grimshawi TaxID=7222 RepID=B4JX70_DROGR|nr:protein SMG9 [Drosophila grimshawi]EDV95346.1 GH17623 [Drosophila grimshawi]
MAESRRRFRNKKRDEGRPGPSASTPVTIARRENLRSPVVTCVQPKILLKKELDANTGSSSSGSNTELTTSFKTIIINRSELPTQQRNSCERAAGFSSISSVAITTAATTTTTPTTSNTTLSTPAPTPTTTTTSNSASNATTSAYASSSSVCPALNSASKEKANGSTSTGGMQDVQLVPPRMTRPTPLLNANARKFFHKSNTDFTVIGVLGAQSVGKSTLLNLLAQERSSDYDYYQHLFAPDANECIFPIRHRSKSQQTASSSSASVVAKYVLRPRTDCLLFFITRERYVLLDSAPMLTGDGTAKDADHLDLHTLSSMMQLLSVCHILLLAIDDINLEQLRLLHAALRLRPRNPNKSHVPDYLPQVLFVRTRAQRQHFEPIHRERLDRQLELLYSGTNLPIYRGRGEARTINTLLLPQLSSNAATAHHPNLAEVVRQFRERVLGTVRMAMCQQQNSNDFSEMHWFDMLAETVSKCNAASQHFEQIYAENKLSHLELRSKLPSCDSNWRNDSC